MTWALFGVAIMLGIRHALAPDHMAAVAAYVEKSRANAAQALGYALRIGIGHSVGMIVIAALVLLVLHAIPIQVAGLMSRIAGVWLVLVAWLVWRQRHQDKTPNRMSRILNRWIGSPRSSWLLGFLLGLAIAPGDLAIFLLMINQERYPASAGLLLAGFLVAMIGALMLLGVLLGAGKTRSDGHRDWRGWLNQGVTIMSAGVGMALIVGVLH